MKIAVNTRLLLSEKMEGIGWFSFETLQRITQAHPEHEFFFFFDRSYDPKFLFSSNVTPIILRPVARHPFLWYAWFEWAIPRALKKVKADVFLSPDGYVSLRTNVPTVSVIHDINFEHRPQDLPWLVRKYYQFYFPRFAKKANQIVTVSNYSKKDIIKTYGITADKITVAHNGVNEVYAPLLPGAIKATRQQYTQGCPYFLFVGALHPRKNLVNLFKAFELFKTNNKQVKLLIVGDRQFWNNEIAEAYKDVTNKEDITFTGHLELVELRNVMGSALALTYISFFEGFGMPVAEAMQSGVPVIAAKSTSLPEVAQEAALYVNPHEVDNIAQGMGQIAEDENLRANLIAKGLLRAQAFNWGSTAEKLWLAIEKVDGKC